MAGLTVLSPHRDDAVFSLGLALSRWTQRRLPVTVLNFFTRSNYAPYSSALSIEDISFIREREDRRALRSLDRNLQIHSLDLLDAPIRLNIDFGQITQSDTQKLLTVSALECLGRKMQPYFVRGLILAPLGLGNHIDHQAVHQAALQSRTGRRLGFYEDLPYASWTAKEELRARVAGVEEVLRADLKPLIIRNRKALAAKFHAASCYSSQIDREMALTITRYARRYSGGERIWVPRRGVEWHPLEG